MMAIPKILFREIFGLDIMEIRFPESFLENDFERIYCFLPQLLVYTHRIKVFLL